LHPADGESTEVCLTEEVKRLAQAAKANLVQAGVEWKDSACCSGLLAHAHDVAQIVWHVRG